MYIVIFVVCLLIFSVLRRLALLAYLRHDDLILNIATKVGHTFGLLLRTGGHHLLFQWCLIPI